MEQYSLSDSFKNESFNSILENIVNNSIDNLSNEEIFLNIKNKEEFINIINFYSKNIHTNIIINDKPVNPIKIEVNEIFYYSNFILITEDTVKLIFDNISQLVFLNSYFGQNIYRILHSNNMQYYHLQRKLLLFHNTYFHNYEYDLLEP